VIDGTLQLNSQGLQNFFVDALTTKVFYHELLMVYLYSSGFFITRKCISESIHPQVFTYQKFPLGIDYTS